LFLTLYAQTVTSKINFKKCLEVQLFSKLYWDIKRREQYENQIINNGFPTQVPRTHAVGMVVLCIPLPLAVSMVVLSSPRPHAVGMVVLCRPRPNL
jgi:hypothetical protein